MNKGKAYTGVDMFRVAAAFLVVAIHTSPLASFTEVGDFIVTRVVARIAVPFFFMTSGYFLISRYAPNAGRLQAFEKKTAAVYGAAIALYLPLNLYNRYFSMDHLLPNLIKDLVFDGTMYHLWYLPAAMLGAAVAWLLVRKCGFRCALQAAGLLYLAGLLGDSYYGVVKQTPWLQSCYAALFELSDYTRNGVFFAPLFFVLGGWLAGRAQTPAKGAVQASLKKSLAGFALSLLLMMGEGLLLRGWGFQRHDSMYLFLPLCVYFLFCALLCWRGPRRETLRTAALLLYIVHPMAIVLVRLAAKITGLTPWLVNNSLAHYLAVCAVSAAVSFPLAGAYQKWAQKRKMALRPACQRAWIELNLNHLLHNARELKKAMPPKCRLMAVVKAEAYGHGAYEVAAALNQNGVKAFAVATVEEGIRLRRYGVTGEILILGYTDPARAKDLFFYHLTQTLIDYDYAVRLNRQGYPLRAHIKIDTGMHRLGFAWEDVDKVAAAYGMRRLKIRGVFTHLCVSGSLRPEDVCFTKTQLQRFGRLLGALKDRGLPVAGVHVQSSYGLLNYPQLQCSYVRAGVALYGVLSSPGDETRLQLDLRPVLSLKSKIVLIRRIKAGETVGYGRLFTAERDSTIAVLPIGYADGYPRRLSGGKASVLINGQEAPVIGAVCMDQLTVDITDIPQAKVGMTATLIGADGGREISAPDVADAAQSITNELLSRMGRRLTVTR